jgi:hypothetical protein
MGIEFGGKHARATGTFKSLGWSLQYVNDEPALVIWRLAALNSALRLKNDGACVICLSAAHKYRSDNQRNLRENFPHLIAAAKAIGLDVTSRHDLRVFIDCCEHKLAELAHMKPSPEIFKAAPGVEVSADGDSLRVVVH